MDRLVVEPLKHVQANVFKQLKRLNNGYNRGCMAYILDDPYAQDTASVYYIIDESEKVLSWAMVYKKKGHKLYETHFYTRVKARGKGLGSRLAYKVASDLPNQCKGYTECSTLFGRNGITLRGISFKMPYN